jgi:hypothetical protein
MPDSHAIHHHDDRELDALLNEALTSYVDQEPDPSLRTRIFARMDEAAPPLRRIGWLAATACAAALLLAFLLYPANRAPQNQPVQNRAMADRAVEDHAAATAPAQPPAASAKLGRTLTDSTHPHVVPATRHRYYRKEPNAPRRSISLASAPLTEEEAMLLRFAQQHPEQAREVLSPPPTGPIHSGALHTDPLIIAPIQIAALSDSLPNSH